MNIKGLAPTILDTVKPVPKTERAIKSDQTHDRDPNGQQAFPQNQENQHGPMSDEQFNKALEHLKSLPAFKEHKWTVESEVQDDQTKIAIIKDNLGNLIRRIPEKELWTLPDEDNPKGQLFKKTA